MAFNPDDKIQWENLAPTLQALLERKMEEHSRNYFNNHINIYVNQAISSSNSYTDSKISQLQSLLESKIASLGSGGGGTSSGGGSKPSGGGGTSSGGGSKPSGGGGNPPSGGGGGENPPSGGGGGENPPSGGGGGESKPQPKKTIASFEIYINNPYAGAYPNYYVAQHVNARVYQEDGTTLSTATLSIGPEIESDFGPDLCVKKSKEYVNAHIDEFKSRIAHGTEATETIVTTKVHTTPSDGRGGETG